MEQFVTKRVERGVAFSFADDVGVDGNGRAISRNIHHTTRTAFETLAEVLV